MLKYKSNPDYVMRNISGDHVLIKTLNNSVGNTSVYIFNDSGAFLWNNLSEKKSRTQLVTLLIEKYSIEQTQAETDVGQFLDKCITEGFVSEYDEER